MPAIRHPRRAAPFAVGLLVTGAFAVFGSAPAFSYTHIYGSGAALQGQLQNDILIPDSGLSGEVTFTATTSGKGFEEFGNTNGEFEWTDTSLVKPSLDAFVATDSPPNATEEANTQDAKAAGSTSTDEITVPVAQTPLDILLSLPSGITLNAGQNIDLTASLASELYAETVPQPTSNPESYAANTWGALLTDAGLTETSSASPGPGEFYDSGTSGGSTTITVEVRKNGAGTTLNLKQYLAAVDASTWSSFVNPNSYPASTEWPATFKNYLPTEKGNSTDANEVEAVDKNPGTVGYATAGDTNEATSPNFTSLPQTSTTGGSHQILYALLQDNYAPGSRAQPIYANPEANGTGTANVYTGSNIEVNSSTSGGAGSWAVPSTGGTFDADGTWTGTRASDPDIYDDSGDSIAYYPLVAVAFDLSWSDFSVGNLAGDYGGDNAAAQATTQDFLEFATSTTGQADIAGHYFYAPLPSDPGNSSLANIDAVAHSAAGGI